MRRFFLFTIFMICFVCAGIMKEDFAFKVKDFFENDVFYVYEINFGDKLNFKNIDKNISYICDIKSLDFGKIKNKNLYQILKDESKDFYNEL